MTPAPLFWERSPGRVRIYRGRRLLQEIAGDDLVTWAARAATEAARKGRLRISSGEDLEDLRLLCLLAEDLLRAWR